MYGTRMWSSYPVNSSSSECPPQSPRPSSSQVLIPFQMAKRMEAVLTPLGRVFQRDGATAEKPLLLEPACWNSLGDGILCR